MGREKIEKIIDKINLHYGDTVIFEKGEYEILINIYPPIDNNWSKAEVLIYFNKQAPYYDIYVSRKMDFIRT